MYKTPNKSRGEKENIPVREENYEKTFCRPSRFKGCKRDHGRFV
jgi:hypothetical protein